MKYASFIIIFIISINCFGQTKDKSCTIIYLRAQELFKQGNYKLALNKLAAYKQCDPGKTSKADSLILLVYQTINNQKTEAITQKNIANRRSKIIEEQRDSINKENIANKIATQALQINELNPSQAVNDILTGLCFSPDNSALIEIKRKILTSEVLFSNMHGASIYNTTRIKKLNASILITGDGEGNIKLWNSQTKLLEKEIKLFNASINDFEVVNDNYLLVIGRDVQAPNNTADKIKLIELSTCTVTPIYDDSAYTYTTISGLGDANTVYLGDEKGTIKKFSLSTRSTEIVVRDSSKITGLQCWHDEKKVFYSTPFGVYMLGSNLRIYGSGNHSFITYLGLCQSTCDLFIGIGEDLVLFNYPGQKDQILYPIHKGMITSCNCANSAGGFMTTSLDKYAALWTSNGNLKQVLKGNGAELYDGYLDDNAGFAVTVGRREMSSRNNSDTNTVKYWFLNGFQNKVVTAAHFMGATSVINAAKTDLFITTGNDGKIKIWDSSLNPLSFRKISDDVINTLEWNPENGHIYYGTSSGEVGFVTVDTNLKISAPTVLKYHKAAVSGIKIRDNLIYSSGKDGVIYVYSPTNCIDSLFFDSGINSISFSGDETRLLIASGKSVIVYNIEKKSRKIYKHEANVNATVWVSKSKFAATSGQFLCIWNVGETDIPLLKVDNNIKNIMTSICVDSFHHIIYTGTWSGYVICWDYLGKELFEFDQLASLANTNIIQSICNNRDKSKVVTVDYNGNIASWYSPIGFFERELNLDIDCGKILSDFKRNTK